jgi:hypothetical protein
MESIKLLLSCIPAWAVVVTRSIDSIEIDVSASHESGQPLRPYRLLLRQSGGRTTVQENGIPPLLPKFCLQRHTNGDETFCIGYEAEYSINGEEAASKWWRLLLSYLRCQEIAHLSRRWPPNKGLSHGEAAAIQLEAEAKAHTVGLLAAY